MSGNKKRGIIAKSKKSSSDIRKRKRYYSEKYMAFGYSHNKEEKEKLSKGDYIPSKHKIVSDKNYGVTIVLLMLREKIDNIDFTNEEIEFYKKLAPRWHPEKSIEMKENLKQILKEQSIVSGVSVWEGYFLSASEDILTESILKKKIYRHKEKLQSFLKEFNLRRDFESEMFSNGYQFENLNFAKFIKNKRKINFQDEENVKNFLKIIYDLDIVRIDTESEKDWTGIVKFIQNRHELIHKKYEENNYNMILNKYSKESIESIINNMSKLISKIDYELYLQYEKR